MKASLFFMIISLLKVSVVSALAISNRTSIDEPPDPQCETKPFTIKWKGFKLPFVYQKFQHIDDHDRGAWIDPSLVPIIFSHTIQYVGVVFPDPLLPTDNTTILGVYREAMEALQDYESKPENERAQDEREYIQNRNCWKVRLTCRGSSFPWYTGCESDMQAAALHDWLSEKSIEHDLMTVQLMERSHRMGLVDLGHTLISMVNRIGDGEKADDDPFNDAHIFDGISDSSVNFDEDPLMKLHKTLEKRVKPLKPNDGREDAVIQRLPLPTNVLIPHFMVGLDKFRIFYEDPLHWAQYEEVVNPHLPGYPVLPQPLLPATTPELQALYKRALHYYAEDGKLTPAWKRLREARRQKDTSNWVKGHPCYCQYDLCDVVGYWDIMESSYYEGQEGLRVNLVMQAELLGLVDLGERLTVELNGGQAPF